MSIEVMIDKAKEQKVVAVSFIFPMGVFKILNAFAAKEGKNFPSFVGDILRSKAEELTAKYELEKKG